ncbi:MAG: magnesium chelatase, partial [Chloroflexota bacterium]
VASANPEDYTNRGRIITPLKDRYGAQIRTHYPRTLEHEMRIMEQERTRVEDVGVKVVTPQYMREVIAEITTLARRSPDINQRSGVSVRVSIANYETLDSNALRRAIRCKEAQAAPRMRALGFLVASTVGKSEMETVEEGSESRTLEGLTKKAVSNVFGRYFTVQEFDDLVHRFEEGLVIETSDMLPSAEYARKIGELPELAAGVRKLGLGESPAAVASAVEFILEGLHLNRRLNRDRVEGKTRYRG